MCVRVTENSSIVHFQNDHCTPAKYSIVHPQYSHPPLQPLQALQTSIMHVPILKHPKTLRQRLHGTGSDWNRYEIGTDKPCVYTGPGGSGTDRICYLVPNGSDYEGDPIWNHTVSVSNRSRVNRVDPYSHGYPSR